jgi:hypothetical protein
LPDFLYLAKIIVSFPKHLLKFQDTSLPTPNPVAGQAWPRLNSRQDGMEGSGVFKGWVIKKDVGEELLGSRV